MLVKLHDGKGSELTYGFRFFYPVPKEEYSRPVKDFLLEGDKCPIGICECLEANSDVPWQTWEEILTGKHLVNIEPRRAECIVERITDGKNGKRKAEFVFRTQAVCNPIDNFNKRVGRFLAFQRAVMTFIDILPEDICIANTEAGIRRKVWDAFRAQKTRMPSSAELAMTREPVDIITEMKGLVNGKDED